MKKQLLYFGLGFCLLTQVSRSQSSITFSTGFNTVAEQSVWTQYRKGDQGLYQFTYSAPVAGLGQSLYHGYPVGGTIATKDWIVSPAFNFANGGTLDSIRCSFHGFGSPAAADSVTILLLNGSSDPALATSATVLFDFRGNNYTNDGVWRKFSNISIPQTNGQSYIAIKYKTVNNWLSVYFDNITITQNAISTVGIMKTHKQEDLSLFPNPIEKGLAMYLKSDSPEKDLQLRIFNSLGALVFEKEMNSQHSIELNEAAGVYFYQLVTTEGKILKAGKLIVK